MPSPLTAFRATQVTAQVYWLQVWLAFAAEAQARQYLHYYDTIKRARPLTADGAPKSSARELTELLAMLGPGAWRAPAFFDGVGALAHTRTPPPPPVWRRQARSRSSSQRRSPTTSPSCTETCSFRRATWCALRLGPPSRLRCPAGRVVLVTGRRQSTSARSPHLPSPQTCGVGVGQAALTKALTRCLEAAEEAAEDDVQGRMAIALLDLPMAWENGAPAMCCNTRMGLLWERMKVRCARRAACQ